MYQCLLCQGFSARPLECANPETNVPVAAAAYQECYPLMCTGKTLKLNQGKP